MLVELARTPLCRALWTETILDEMVASVLKERPAVRADRMLRMRKLMNQAVPDCLVYEYEHLIPSLRLPDENDRHVLAAAIVGGADVIVTDNVADFPPSVLKRYRLKTQTTDKFLCSLLSMDADPFIEALERVRKRLKAPSQSSAVFIEGLESCGLVETIARLRPIYRDRGWLKEDRFSGS